MPIHPAWSSLCRTASILLLAALPAAASWTETASHATPTTIPGATGPLFEMQSATVASTGTTLTFNVSFFAPTAILGPSTGTPATSVYGFFNLDTDRSAATGLSPSALNAGLEGGYGQYVPAGQGTDAIISLTSEGNVFGHNFQPNLVDLIRASDGVVLDTVAIIYGSSPGKMSFSLSLGDFSSLPGGSTIDSGGPLPFAVVVGNVDSATDVLSPLSTVPEPGSIALILEAALGALGVARLRRRRRAG